MTQRILEEAKQRLREVEDGIATMQTKYRECIAKKEELELKCEQCEQRLGRADKVGRAGWEGLWAARVWLGGGPAPLPQPLAWPTTAHPTGPPLQLINGLSDEKVRWQETVENLEHMLGNISGDVLVAAGFVAYLGPFTVRSLSALAATALPPQGAACRAALPSHTHSASRVPCLSQALFQAWKQPEDPPGGAGLLVGNLSSHLHACWGHLIWSSQPR